MKQIFSFMFDQLTRYLTDRQTIDFATLALICSKFEVQKTRRNEILLSPGQICQHYYFVNKGCLRLFTINKEGIEGTRYFAFEGAFGTALPSLIDQQPAFEYVQTIEPAELLVISRTDFYWLVDNVPAFGAIYRAILEIAFISAQKRIYGFQGLEAIEKVRWAMASQPKLLGRVSSKLVASYLGITPATLSRLKAQL
ncbi:Crp/Fnr family transcriptional regulator [uncultured Fibrella sp.]|uniref:Crp/Fnr family transcriptional regulator n=1 Tax=uncultured Fibrella sp. TaxID=1284596 RepID=UPI0035CB32C8